MPVSVYYVRAVQKRSKIESAQKNPEKLQKFYFEKTHGARRASPAEAHGLHTMPSRGLEGGGAATWWGRLVHALALPFGLYIAPAPKTLEESTISPEEFRSSAATKNPNSGDRSLCFGTLPGWGIAPRSHLHRLHRHLHRRCCLPWWGGSSSSSGLRALPVAMWFVSLSHGVIFMWSWAL